MTGNAVGARRGDLPASIARRLMRDYLDRGLTPGDALADEATLLERYGVSRGTFREALRMLTFLGAITVKAGREGGPRLSTPGPDVVGSTLGMVVQFRNASLRTVLDARAAIEPGIAAMAAVNRTDDDLAELAQSVRDLRATQQQRGPGYARCAERQMLLVARASSNPVLETLVPALHALTTSVRFRHPPGSRARMSEQVAQVVDAIEAHDAATAATVTAQMLTGLIASIDEYDPDSLDSRIIWPDLDETLSEMRARGGR